MLDDLSARQKRCIGMAMVGAGIGIVGFSLGSRSVKHSIGTKLSYLADEAAKGNKHLIQMNNVVTGQTADLLVGARGEFDEIMKGAKLVTEGSL